MADTNELTLDLFAFDSVGGPLYRCRGEIHVSRGGRLADFDIALSDENDKQVAGAQLLGYPRWSESLTAFLARCLAKALQGRPTLACPVVRFVSLDVRLGTQLLAEHCVHLEGGQLFVDGCTVELPENLAGKPGEPQPLWQLMSWGLAYSQWGKVEVPATPGPIQARLYYHEGRMYCRTSDLPGEAQLACERWLFGQATPQVPDIPDAIFAEDLQRFLG